MELNEKLNNEVIAAMLKSIKSNLEEEADKVIVAKVEEFKRQLIGNKNKMITEMMNAIEIQTRQDPMRLTTEFNIYIRPKYVIEHPNCEYKNVH